ncbi:MAG: ribulose-phosphate 3-epimerase, partial [Desulfobacter postgatei]
QVIKRFNVKAGVALNPATPLSSIEYIIDMLDFVLIMSVNPGFGGQQFINSSLKKITALSNMLSDAGSNAIIQVDGGVNSQTMEAVARAGAHCFVAGSAIFKTPDYKTAINGLRTLSDKGKI